jgi:tRNA(Ile)-lysidine synthase
VEKRLHDQLQALGCLDKKILLAASGGLDSTVLLHLLVKLEYTTAVAHANFQLRGEESEQDEAWVRQLANDFQLPFYTQRFETNNYATENGLSIQMAARQLRYEWFDALCDKLNYDFVATAHHLNDNLETVLLNFTRCAGLAGLQGIPQKKGRIIRPLLPFSRKEMEEYARANRLTWREDSSNNSDDYNRNFIRHHVVSKLKELNPSLEETFGRNNERLHAAGELVRRAFSQLREIYVLQSGDHITILKSLTGLFQYPAPVLLELIKDYGFNLDQCIEVALAVPGQPGKRFLSNSHQLVIDRDHLIISARKDKPGEVEIEEGAEDAVLGQLVLNIGKSAAGEIHPEEKSPANDRRNKGVAVLDNDKLQYPLLWRTWKPGDSFFPLGMDHRKKISDFLVDNKISMTDKEDVSVLESGGEIAWVVGYRVDNRFKVGDGTKERVVFTLKGLRISEKYPPFSGLRQQF